MVGQTLAVYLHLSSCGSESCVHLQVLKEENNLEYRAEERLVSKMEHLWELVRLKYKTESRSGHHDLINSTLNKGVKEFILCIRTQNMVLI